MCNFNIIINGRSQTVGAWLIKSDLVMPIRLDYYNNQKHITVSHLTALDRPKRSSYSADANLRCNVVTQSFSKMMFYQHRYFHLFSEKCISQEVSLIQCLTYSEKCIEAMRHHYVHWQVS